MYILIKNATLAISYICLLLYVFVSNQTIGYMDRMLVMCTLYYMVLIVPKIHQYYVFSIVERVIPKWTYLLRAAFHYTLFYPTLTKSFPSVVSICILMMWKDIVFLITHAEKRLAKIEMSMFDEEIGQRVAHLHLNVFKDDINNRFHKHCFDTNRIYMIENTELSNETNLAIYNYRKLRLDGKTPRNFTEDDSIHYDASNNQRIFISNRKQFIIIPLLIICWLMIMTDRTLAITMYINHGIILLDIISQRYGNKVNDIVIGSTYFVSMVVIVNVYATYT